MNKKRKRDTVTRSKKYCSMVRHRVTEEERKRKKKKINEEVKRRQLMCVTTPADEP
jgi:hypothetical protein